MRTTKSELTAVFQSWLTANNFDRGLYQSGTFDIVPGYILDYAPSYGGYRIEYLMASTGRRTPFGDRRHSASELAAMMRFQMDALEEAREATI